MSNKDPFFPSGGNSDRTVIKPVPGGRAPDTSRPGTPPPPPTPPGSGGRQPPGPGVEELSVGPGLNPLEAAGARLLSLASHLRTATSEPDLRALRDRIVKQLKQFEEDATRAGYRSDVVRYAHYTLCAFLDEVVLGTPWGGRSRWQENSLLSTFHRETWGGEQVFKIIDKAKRDSAGNIDLLEFLYVVLGLGFEGAYGAATDGREKLERVRDSLFESIRNQRPERDHDLSGHWRGANAGKVGLNNFLPPWAIASIAAALMLVIFFSFSFILHRESDPLMSRLATINAEAMERLEMTDRAAPPTTDTLVETLQRLLAEDIDAGNILIEADGRRVILRLAGDGLFASASARVESDRLPVIERIGRAIDQVEGQVLVSGHSDNVPIRTLRFPSNWYLSEARAESVERILKLVSDNPGRFSAEGRADTEPLASNETAEGRARNRRVDIAVTATTGERS